MFITSIILSCLYFSNLFTFLLCYNTENDYIHATSTRSIISSIPFARQQYHSHRHGGLYYPNIQCSHWWGCSLGFNFVWEFKHMMFTLYVNIFSLTAFLLQIKITLKGHHKRITGLAFSDVLNVLVSSGADSQVSLEAPIISLACCLPLLWN